jgi:hypothetical protein
MARKARKPKPVGTAATAIRYPGKPERLLTLGHNPARSGTSPLDGLVLEGNEFTAGAVVASAVPAETSAPSAPLRLNPVYRDDAHGIWLYHGNCLSILDAIYAKHGDAGCFDMIAVEQRTAAQSRIDDCCCLSLDCENNAESCDPCFF